FSAMRSRKVRKKYACSTYSSRSKTVLMGAFYRLTSTGWRASRRKPDVLDSASTSGLRVDARQLPVRPHATLPVAPVVRAVPPAPAVPAHFASPSIFSPVPILPPLPARRHTPLSGGIAPGRLPDSPLLKARHEMDLGLACWALG